MMKGINFVIDSDGKKVAVLIDLKRLQEIWEDFYDCLLVEERKSEPTKSLKELERKIGTKALRKG